MNRNRYAQLGALCLGIVIGGVGALIYFWALDHQIYPITAVATAVALVGLCVAFLKWSK